ncbi:NAD(P)/FAD-dependent oxidoreductase [Erythrobacter sp. HKB08]|uniref:NAD(P)/FAD-dependent oxidoreductase n=1 Tax=Erythrobacter sp. HKB08 TaxID=2502843 RepID=UPI0018F8B3D8|nr:FAD-dependent oxidoreductase [Erythrobacter sp. HKB08]
MDGKSIDIAIIGGGMAGLACATELACAGHAPVVFDKGRGPGGRMATRRAEVGGETLRFDHGAQYFTARDPDFLAAVEAWEQAGVVARWPAAGDEAWVGTPGMNAPIRAMADDLDVQWGTRIERIERGDNDWTLHTESDVLHARTIICAIPAEQAAVLLESAAPHHATLAAGSQSDPCWAIMAHFPQALAIESDTLRSKTGPIGWAARNGAKPGRDGSESWVVHASPDRSREILECEQEEAARLVLADFFEFAGIAPVEPDHLAAHRWRYAQADPVGDAPCLWDAGERLGVCGDWLVQARVEGAFKSGLSLARAILGTR